MSEFEKGFLFKINLLSPREVQILKDLFYHEPDCAKFIARRIRLDLKEVFEGLKFLENLGMIERVLSPFVRKGKKLKHRNHTYYELKREWRVFLKKYLHQRGEYESGA